MKKARNPSKYKEVSCFCYLFADSIVSNDYIGFVAFDRERDGVFLRGTQDNSLFFRAVCVGVGDAETIR